MEFVKYDNRGRLEYHPELHPNQGKDWTISELEYLCKFYDIDGPKTISLALGKTELTVTRVFHQFKRNGLYDYYKKLNVFYTSV